MANRSWRAPASSHVNVETTWFHPSLRIKSCIAKACSCSLQLIIIEIQIWGTYRISLEFFCNLSPIQNVVACSIYNVWLHNGFMWQIYYHRTVYRLHFSTRRYMYSRYQQIGQNHIVISSPQFTIIAKAGINIVKRKFRAQDKPLHHLPAQTDSETRLPRLNTII